MTKPLKERASAAFSILHGFAMEHGLTPIGDCTDNETLETAAVDLITDIMHCLIREDISIEGVLAQANSHCEDEQEEEEERDDSA